MRKLLFFLTTFSLLSIPLLGQENKSVKDTITSIIDKQEHFTFLDIPINGSIKEFVKKLENKNFKLEDITEVDAVLTGRFTGEKVQLLVQGKKETVASVIVILPERESLFDATSRYTYIKSKLIQIYGEPEIIEEKFEEFNNKTYEDEKKALKDGLYIFESHFLTENGIGMIRLKIESDLSILINYVDTKNYKLLSNDAFKEY